MFSNVTIASLSWMVFVMGFAVEMATAQPGAVQVPGPGMTQIPGQARVPELTEDGEEKVFNLENLTREEFDSLPENRVVEVGGVQTTKREYLARLERQHDEALSKLRAAAIEARAMLEAKRDKFLQNQVARIEKDNAKTLARFAESGRQRRSIAQSAGFNAIRKEATELERRSQTASPAEQAQIEQRAWELLQQLQGLPR
jgi:hypothetical protein